VKIARKTIDWTKNPYREPERGAVSETEIELISGGIIHRMGLAVGWLVGVALAVVAAAFVLVSIQSVWNWGFLPTLAEMHDDFLLSNPPSATETEHRLLAVDDCLVKAVAKQPPGRLRRLLLNDLFADCQYSVTAAWLAIHPNDKEAAMGDVVSGVAINEIARRYSAIIARAQPR
jgi:hypothetical protein